MNWFSKKFYLLVLIFSFCFIIHLKAQEGNSAGNFSLGVRNTASLFGDAGVVGLGFGGQFRIQLGKYMNTEWFADYASTNIKNLGYRKDSHIGWSVIFYPFKNPRMVNAFTPYLLAGHCFDYTRVTPLNITGKPVSRWSTATQMGIGVHYLLTPEFDISLSSQYMIHLGGHVDAHIVQNANGNYLEVYSYKGVDFEGHLFITLSFNYTIGKLWNREK